MVGYKPRGGQLTRSMIHKLRASPLGDATRSIADNGRPMADGPPLDQTRSAFRLKSKSHLFPR